MHIFLHVNIQFNLISLFMTLHAYIIIVTSRSLKFDVADITVNSNVNRCFSQIHKIFNEEKYTWNFQEKKYIYILPRVMFFLLRWLVFSKIFHGFSIIHCIYRKFQFLLGETCVKNVAFNQTHHLLKIVLRRKYNNLA